MKLKSLLHLACLVAVLSVAQSVSAQAVISLNATSDDHILGYQYGQNYTFVFTVTDGNFANINGLFISNLNNWQETTGDIQLYTTITGTGVTGTFSQPDSPYSYLRISNTQTLDLFAGTNASPNGLKSLDNTDVKLGVHITAGPSATLFDDYPSETQPSAYLAEHTGNYAFSGQSGGYVILYTADSQYITFTITDLTISAPTPVPEPATCAALAGLGALGLALWRRHQRR